MKETISEFREGVCPQHHYQTTDEKEWSLHILQPHKTRKQLEWESLSPFGRELMTNHPLTFKLVDEWMPYIIISIGFGIPILLKIIGL